MARSGVDTFGRSEFESALPCHRDTGAPLWAYVGCDKGEHVYRVDVLPGSPLTCLVRSSIKPDGVSAECGEDSIRLFAVVRADLDGGRVTFHGGKLSKYVTRRPGWADRLADQLRRFAQLLRWCVPCAGCGSVLAPFTTRKKDSPNKGRDFVKCCGCERRESWAWVENEEGQPIDPPNNWQKASAARPTSPAQSQPAPAANAQPQPRPCPRCNVPALLPSIKGPGFHCFRRLNGCGAVLTEAEAQPAPAARPTRPAMTAEAVRGEMEVLAMEEANATGRPPRRISMAEARRAQAAIARNPGPEDELLTDDNGRYHPEQRNPNTHRADGRRIGPTTPATGPALPPDAAPQPDPVPGFTCDPAALLAALRRLGAYLEQNDPAAAEELARLIAD